MKNIILFMAFCCLVFLDQNGVQAAPTANPSTNQVVTQQVIKPVPDKPNKDRDRVTVISLKNEGSDSLGSRLATRLKERFNQSNLFELNDNESKDQPKMHLLLTTAPEFPSRPSIGSVYGICWVFSQGKGYLRYLLGHEVGIVNGDNLDALVDRLVERTDGISTKYANLWP